MMDAETVSAEPTPSERLREEIVALGGGLGKIIAHSSKGWPSITFAGERHWLTVCFEGKEAVACGERFVAFLPEHEFAIPHYLIADAAVAGVDHCIQPPTLTARVELLLIEDGA